MDLTAEAIKATPVLADITDEQAAAIIQLSSDATSKTIGEVHRQYDETIQKVTGVERDGSEKSYKYLERAGNAIKAKADAAAELEGQLQTLKTERDALSEQLKNTGDSEVAAKLAEAKAELKDVTSRFQAAQKEIKGLTDKHQKELAAQKIDITLSTAASGLQFKKEIPSDIIPLAISNAINKIKEYEPSFDDNGNIIFKDENGVIIKNEKAEPISPAELLRKQLASSLDNGRTQTGAGTGGGLGSDGDGCSIDTSAVTTKTELFALISKTLGERGLVKGTDEYAKAQKEIIATVSNYDKLPM